MKRLTNEEFLQRVQNLVGQEYSFLEKFINTRTNIKVRHNCDKCKNYEYKVSPKHFLAGRRCPKCAKLNNNINMRKTSSIYKKEIYNLVKDEYSLVGEYINAKTRVTIRHNNCNKIYTIFPQKFLSNQACPYCSNIIRNKTTEQFKQEVYCLVGDEYTILGEYFNNYTNIKIRHNCLKCNNYEWETTSPNKFLRGTRCPKCNESKGEKTISNYLDLNNINYKTQYKIEECKNINALPFDFAIFDKNENLLGLIEYDGEQHFKLGSFGSKDENEIEKKFQQTQFRDQIKTNYCKDKNIALLRIKYTEFNNINDILEEFIHKIYKDDIHKKEVND